MLSLLNSDFKSIEEQFEKFKKNTSNNCTNFISGIFEKSKI